MFDADTVTLIASAPPLPGLDLAQLPKLLTNAYATLVATRIRIRELNQDSTLPDVAREIVRQTNRIAYSQEALVSVLGERENRAAAAFVAGAAHHVVLLADRIREGDPRPSRLEAESIPPEVSATILFLIAESSADAAEMAKHITIDSENAVEAALLSAIVHLANGRLQRLLDIPLPTAELVLAGSQLEQGANALYLMLLRGVRTLAADMLGAEADVLSTNSDAHSVFEDVKSLCIQSLDDLSEAVGSPPYSVFPGPHHLASLLSSASHDLAASALVNTPSPSGVDGAEWHALMKSIAARRPYLWRNHRQAIASGYLEPGISAAVSFPTGAGKSTLAELKIASTLLLGAKVVFLAPTLALVEQTASALKKSFPDSDLLRERTDELVLDVGGDTLPSISVMTPERCLAMLSFNREIFSDVGLLVFDECHLLHPRQSDASRRAVDAMLCVLNFIAVAPSTDLLFLSAMMMNTSEMAQWMGELTGRQCLSLDLTWKPTRQVRGCVVYGDEEVNELNQRLRETRASVPNKNAPVRLQRSLKASPFGFFCLRQTWQSKARKDYALLPLLDEKVTLSTGTTKAGNWYLTPNGNQVSAAIAGATARRGLKTLVFTQTIPLANSAVKTLVSDLGQLDCPLSLEEMALYNVAADELGGAAHLYLDIDEQGRLRSSSACHHGLLLPSERNLHESLFRRKDGINVLVATSTLAQGMNLPSEVVIIGGDSRFDSDAERMEKLEAHELLNAAGRAGRAGDASYGFVLVVPSKVVNFNDENSRIHNHWADLQTIFAQSDQCLTIDDPMTALLDQIHNGVASGVAMYLLRRLPVGTASESQDEDAPAKALLGRSFAAFRARKNDDAQWVQSRIGAALTLRRTDPDASAVLTWADRLAASAGIPVSIIRELGEPLSGTISGDATLRDWYLWLSNWLKDRPLVIMQLIRKESLEKVFGSVFKKLDTDEARGKYAAERIFSLTESWMAGHSLADMERALGTKEAQLGKCETAREFVLRVLTEISYIFSLPAQILRAIALDNEQQAKLPLAVELLGSCVRQGFDNADQLVLRQYLSTKPARRAVHRKFEEIASVLQPPAEGEDFGRAFRRVAQAVELSTLL